MWIHLHGLDSLMWHNCCRNLWNDWRHFWCLCFIHCLQAITISLGKSDTHPQAYPSIRMQWWARTLKINSLVPMKEVSTYFHSVPDVNTDDVPLYILTLGRPRDLCPVCCDTTWMYWGNLLCCATIKWIKFSASIQRRCVYTDFS